MKNIFIYKWMKSKQLNNRLSKINNLQGKTASIRVGLRKVGVAVDNAAASLKASWHCTYSWPA